jgi:hypothetical protein
MLWWSEVGLGQLAPYLVALAEPEQHQG